MTMDLAAVKNEIKVVFYIINAFSALVPGSILFGFGVAIWAVNGSPGSLEGIGMMILGMVGVGIATLGFAGGLLEHKIMLIGHSSVLSLVTIINIITCLIVRYQYDAVWLGISITHLSLAMFAVALSVAQVRLIRERGEQGRIISPAPATAPAPAQASTFLGNNDYK